MPTKPGNDARRSTPDASSRPLFARSLSTMAIWLLLILFGSGTVGSFWYLHEHEVQLSYAYPLQGTALQALSLQELQRIYADRVVNHLNQRGIDADANGVGTASGIPSPESILKELGQRLAAIRPGAHIRLFHGDATTSIGEAGPRDDFEREALGRLKQWPDRPFYRFEDFEGRPSLRYAVVDATQTLATATDKEHSAQTAPQTGNGVVRVLEFIRPLDQEVAAGQLARQRGLAITVTMASLGLAGLGLCYVWIVRTARSLRRSEARARAMLNGAVDCIVCMDEEGKVLEFNPAAERLFGVSREDMLGTKLSETIIPAGQRSAHDRGLKRFLETGESTILGKRIELTARRLTGEEIPIELSVNVSWQSRRPVFTAYLRDLSDRKA